MEDVLEAIKLAITYLYCSTFHNIKWRSWWNYFITWRYSSNTSSSASCST